MNALEGLQESYKDYKRIVTLLRTVPPTQNVSVELLIGQEDPLYTGLPAGTLLDLYNDLANMARNALADAYRAEANALEGELI